MSKKHKMDDIQTIAIEFNAQMVRYYNHAITKTSQIVKFARVTGNEKITVTIGDGIKQENGDGGRTLYVLPKNFEISKVFGDISCGITTEKEKFLIQIDAINNKEDAAKVEKFIITKKTDPEQKIICATNSINLKEAFKAEFKGKKVLDKLIAYCAKVVNLWEGMKCFSPTLVICQSSGYGKTRAVNEIGKQHPTAYICLRANNENGFPSGSISKGIFQTLEDIKENNNASPEDSETNNASPEDIKTNNAYLMEVALYALVTAQLDCVDQIKKALLTTATKATLATEFAKHQPWFSNYEAQVQRLQNKIIFIYDKYKTRKTLELLPEDFVNLKKRFVETMTIESKIIPLYIAIDEAHHITKTSAFLHFRHAISTHLKSLPILFIFISTNSAIAGFFLSPEQVTASQREAAKSSVKPFDQLLFIDCCMPNTITYLKELRGFINITNREGLYKFLNDRDPLETLFMLGRPLWSSLKKDFSFISREKLIKSQSDYRNLETIDKYCSTIAILSSRTTLLSTQLVLNYFYSSQLVKGFMGTLFEISDDCDQLFFRYISEPVLAEAASYFMSDRILLASIIKVLNTVMTLTDLSNVGDTGELVAQIVLLVGKDVAALSKSPTGRTETKSDSQFSKPVTVEEFLIGLFGKENYDAAFSPNLNPDVKNGIVSFSHFIKKMDTLKNEGLIYDFIGRGAAGLFRQNFPKFDIFIPIVLPNNEIGFVMVQVKNRKEESTSSKPQTKSEPEQHNLKKISTHLSAEVLRNMIPTEVFKNNFDEKQHMHNTDIKVKNENCVCLFLDLFHEKNFIAANAEHPNIFEICGISADVFKCLELPTLKPNKLVDQLRLTLDCNRFSNVTKFEKFALARAFNGAVEPSNIEYAREDFSN